MADEPTPPNPAAPSATDPSATPAAPPTPPDLSSAKIDSLTAVVNTLVNSIKEREAAGDTQVRQQAAQLSGLDEATITKLMTEAAASGDVPGGVARVAKAIEASSQLSTLSLVGQQKIDLLAVHPEFSGAFTKHGPAFRNYIAKSGLNMAGFAGVNPATQKPYAEELFSYFLQSQTKWYDEKSTERETLARAEERKKVEEEFRVRGGRPAIPSLSPGAAPEGGSLRDSIRRASMDAAELTDAQIDRAKRMGATDADLKSVSEARSHRTSMGTPLTFIPISNEGSH